MFFDNDFIEEVIEKNDIVDVVSTYVKIQKKGSNYVGLCPFHSEKTPSFSVSETKQIYYCFGCHRGGNVIKFVEEYENLSFVEAVKTLAERVRLELPSNSFKKDNDKNKDIKIKLFEIYKDTAMFFYHQLQNKNSSFAKKYFLDRGIKENTITKFGLGYATKKRDELYTYLKSKNYTDEVIKESMLCIIEEKGVRDKFFNRVIFPILDVNSKVIAFGGRVLGDGLPKYLNSNESKIFDKSKTLYALNFAKKSKTDYFILCEGYMDVIALYQAGFDMAIAALGTAFNEKHALMIKRYVKKVYLSFDMDEAGINAVKRTIPILRNLDINVKIISLNPYKDPDEFIKNLGREAFEERIREAKNSFIWEVEVLKNSFDEEDPKQKTDFLVEVAKKLLSIPVSIERENYLSAVCKALSINKKYMEELLFKLAKGVKIEAEIKEKKELDRKEKKINKEDSLYENYINFLINNFDNKEILKSHIKDFMIETTIYQEILRDLYSLENLNIQKIMLLYKSEQSKLEIFSKISNIDIYENLDIKDKEFAISELIKKIKLRYVDKKMQETSDIKEILDLTNEKNNINNFVIKL